MQFRGQPQEKRTDAAVVADPRQKILLFFGSIMFVRRFKRPRKKKVSLDTPIPLQEADSRTEEPPIPNLPEGHPLDGHFFIVIYSLNLAVLLLLSRCRFGRSWARMCHFFLPSRPFQYVIQYSRPGPGHRADGVCYGPPAAVEVFFLRAT